MMTAGEGAQAEAEGEEGEEAAAGEEGAQGGQVPQVQRQQEAQAPAVQPLVLVRQLTLMSKTPSLFKIIRKLTTTFCKASDESVVYQGLQCLPLQRGINDKAANKLLGCCIPS